MKSFIFVIILMGSTSIYAACQIQGVGDDEILDNSDAQIFNSNDADGFSERDNKEFGGSEYGINCDDDPVDLPPMVVTGYYNAGPSYFWMGGGFWFYYLHGGSGGGVSSSAITDSKLQFCFIDGIFEAISNYWPGLGQAATVQSLLNVADYTEKLIILGALRDIRVYVESSRRDHGPSTYTSENFVDWNQLSINWENYGDFSSLPNGTLTNADVFHIYQEFNRQMGNGEVTFEDIMPDPQSHIDC